MAHPDSLANDLTIATTLFITKALQKWSGSLVDKWKLQSAVNGRKLFGRSDDLKRKSYASSPILHQITNYCMKTKGTVFVIYAPSGMGKTTACFAILAKYAKKGVAFSPSDNMGSYRTSILKLIGISSDNPPEGWLEKMLFELQTSFKENPAILLLDDFMNDSPDDPWDEALLKSIKTCIRGKNVCAIVLTKNEESANKMIAWNDMCSILPAVCKTEMMLIRRSYFQWKDQRRKQIEIKNDLKSFQIDWNAHIPMILKTSELKVAILFDPAHVDKSDGEKASLSTMIDEILQDMDPRDRELLQPGTLLQLLVDMKSVPILPSPKKGIFELPSDWTFGCM